MTSNGCVPQVAPNAALVNGTACHALELDDLGGCGREIIACEAGLEDVRDFRDLTRLLSSNIE